MTILQFQSFSSYVDVAFWKEFEKLKLSKLQLSEKPCEIQGYYEISAFNEENIPARFQLDESSLQLNIAEEHADKYRWKCPGILYHTNTLEGFRRMDRQTILRDAQTKLWNIITSSQFGELADITQLSSFVLTVYGELKNHEYYYWFAFPVLLPEEPFIMNTSSSVDEVLTDQERKTFLSFLRSEIGDDDHCSTIEPFFIIWRNEREGTKILSHKCCRAIFENKIPLDHLVFVFMDPSPSHTALGWTLRNYLMFLTYQYYRSLDFTTLSECVLRILSFREPLHSLSEESIAMKRSRLHSVNIIKQLSSLKKDVTPKIKGWEYNTSMKLQPRYIDLKQFLDPKFLSMQAADLNLRLMKWRQLPNIDLNVFKQAKCLVLGAGTLGCNIARCLLGWGINTISFVDNGVINYSNPTRQPLYTFEDCGKKKGLVAADALSKILPAMRAHGYDLQILMPGHPIDKNSLAQIEKDFHLLETLFDQHDIIFLGTDTRESRWLPTVLANSKSKLLINCALGFDTFVVMHNGFGTSDDVACYFCTDIVAPDNSIRDRTLDQACTVTKPSVAPIASAISVELMASILQTNNEKRNDKLPQQIRGSLATFNNFVLHVPSFKHCTACSKKIIQRYKNEGFQFVLSACNKPSYLEEITGLKDLLTQVDDNCLWTDTGDDELSDSTL